MLRNHPPQGGDFHAAIASEVAQFLVAELAREGLFLRVAERLENMAVVNGYTIFGIVGSVNVPPALETFWTIRAREFLRDELRKFLENSTANSS